MLSFLYEYLGSLLGLILILALHAVMFGLDAKFRCHLLTAIAFTVCWTVPLFLTLSAKEGSISIEILINLAQCVLGTMGIFMLSSHSIVIFSGRVLRFTGLERVLSHRGFLALSFSAGYIAILTGFLTILIVLGQNQPPYSEGYISAYFIIVFASLVAGHVYGKTFPVEKTLDNATAA